MEIIKEYTKKLRVYEKVVNYSHLISASTGAVSQSENKIMIHQIYSRIVLNGITINRLCPFNTVIPQIDEFWDWFSIASLSRNLLESYAVFYYWHEKVSTDELDLRKKIQKYHYNCQKFRMYKETSVPQEELKDFMEQLPNDRKELEKHKLFRQIPKSKRNNILEGKNSMTKSSLEILTSLKFNNLPVAGYYTFYSNQVHSDPMGFLVIDNNRGRGLRNEAEVNHVTQALDIISRFMIKAGYEMIKLFPESKDSIGAEVTDYFTTNYTTLSEMKS